MCDIDFDGESPSVWSERTATARKEYQCDSCHGTIRAGKVYGRLFAVSDGYAWDEKLCEACLAISDAFKKEHHGQTGYPSHMSTLLRECIQLEEDVHGPSAPASKKWKKALGEMKRRGTLRTKKVAAPVTAK